MSQVLILPVPARFTMIEMANNCVENPNHSLYRYTRVLIRNHGTGALAWQR